MPHILIVDTANKLYRFLKRELTFYNIHWVKNSQSFSKIINQFHHEVALINASDPKLSAADYVRQLAAWSYPTRTLAYNSRSSDQHIQLLRSGADDCLAQDVEQIEILLKVKKLLNRQKLIEHKCLGSETIKLNLKTGKLQINEKKVHLRKKEAQILSCLLRRRNHIVSRDTIIDSVWPETNNMPTYSTVDVYVRRIRQKLGRNHQGIIETVRGYGYRISL